MRNNLMGLILSLSCGSIILLFDFRKYLSRPKVVEEEKENVRDPAQECFDILRKLPKPLLFVEANTSYPFQLIVDNPEVDTMISRWLVDYGMWDAHVLSALELVGRDGCLEGGMAMDVGANLGFFTNALLAMGCKVASFEMQEQMASRIKFSACSNGHADQLTLHVGAVGDSFEALEMSRGRGNLGGVSITGKHVQHGNSSGDKRVLSSRIDSLMDLKSPIGVMKLDIEGYEDKALYGMSKMFDKKLVQNIVMEFSPNVMGTDRATQMLSSLYSWGFTNISEINFMSPSQYGGPIAFRPVNTNVVDWASLFSHKIAGGGDIRGEKFTDLLLRRLESTRP